MERFGDEEECDGPRLTVIRGNQGGADPHGPRRHPPLRLVKGKRRARR